VSIQVVVPVAGTKVLLAVKEVPVPFHHLSVVVSSIATETVLMLAPVPAEAVPVMVPVQLVP
jgi:hypothetical protein